jgi:hypothetical protein
MSATTGERPMTTRNVMIKVRRPPGGDWLFVSATTGTLTDDGRDRISVSKTFTQHEADVAAFDFLRDGLEVEYVVDTTVPGTEPVPAPPEPQGEPIDPPGTPTPPDPPSAPDEPVAPPEGPSEEPIPIPEPVIEKEETEEEDEEEDEKAEEPVKAAAPKGKRRK